MADIHKRLEYIITDEDKIAFMKYHIKQSRQGRRAVMIQRFVYLLFAALFCAPFFIMDASKNVRMCIVMFSFGLAIIGGIFARKMVITANEKSIMRDSSSLANLHPDKNYVTFKSKAVNISAEGNSRDISYSDIKIVEQNEDGIYIWPSVDEVIQIPAHAFGTKKDKDATYEWLKKKC